MKSGHSEENHTLFEGTLKTQLTAFTLLVKPERVWSKLDISSTFKFTWII